MPGIAGGAAPVVFSGGERALTPLSPAHLRARRTVDGVALSWVRRGRISADSWVPAEIGNDEGFERYRVEILDSETVIRTVESELPSYLYTAADELADFGAPQASLDFRISQAGKRVPWGVPKSARCDI